MFSQWTMEFDAAPQVIDHLRHEMKLDPSVIRCSMLKMGQDMREKVPSPPTQSRDQLYQAVQSHEK
jgi:ribosomal protein S6